MESKGSLLHSQLPVSNKLHFMMSQETVFLMVIAMILLCLKSAFLFIKLYFHYIQYCIQKN